MSNLDWFRLWTMEQEKQGLGGPQGSGGNGGSFDGDGHDGRDGYDGAGGGFGGCGGAFGGMHGGYSPWGQQHETGWQPHLFSENGQASASPSWGSGRAFGPDYDTGHDRGHYPGAFGADHHGGSHGHGDGLDAILFGHLDGGGLHAGFGPGSLVVIPIEHLEINQNTLIQNTNILFDAHGGGSVSVGGDVTAISSQTGLIDHAPQHEAIPA